MFSVLEGFALPLVEQVTQAEIDAGAVKMVAMVTATDAQSEDVNAEGTMTLPLSRENGLLLGTRSSQSPLKRLLCRISQDRLTVDLSYIPWLDELRSLIGSRNVVLLDRQFSIGGLQACLHHAKK